jgi:hypothetical protein
MKASVKPKHKHISRYDITEETRHYVDAILHTFYFPNKINDIRGEIEAVVREEKGDASKENIYRLYFLVKNFLSKNGFGHEEDYVYIIDKKGNDLKECGSLLAFEEKYKNSN